jgi:hypothetical protein
VQRDRLVEQVLQGGHDKRFIQQMVGLAMAALG